MGSYSALQQLSGGQQPNLPITFMRLRPNTDQIHFASTVTSEVIAHCAKEKWLKEEMGGGVQLGFSKRTVASGRGTKGEPKNQLSPLFKTHKALNRWPPS